MLAGNRTAWIAADLDNHDGTKDPEEDVQKVVQVAQALEIPLFVFSSNSNQGFHIYIFFQEPIAAKKARALILTLLARAGVDVSHRRDKEGSFDCVFPKQDTLRGGEIGNLIALPYFGQAITERAATLLIDPLTMKQAGDDPGANLDHFIESVKRIPEDDVDALLLEMGAVTKGQPEEPAVDSGASMSDLPARIQKCTFLRHCAESAASLSEPEWYLMVCILAREYGGPELIHDLSKPYPGYSPEETRQKIMHSLMDQPGPITCRKIKETYDCGRDCGVASPSFLLRRSNSAQGHPGDEDIESALAAFLESAEQEDAEAPLSAAPFLAKLPTREDIKWRQRFKAILGSKLNLNYLAGAIKEERRNLKEEKRKREGEQSSLPTIQVDLHQMRTSSELSLDALKKANDPPFLFVRAGELVRIRTNERGEPFIEPLSESAMRGHLARAADYVIFKNEGFFPTPPPMELVRDILSLPSWDLPPLDSIIETPTLRRDGSILGKPGYDIQTRLYYVATPGFRIPQLSDKPTRDDAQAACQFFLQEVLPDFPFADETSRANVLGLILTAMIRHTISGKVPLALIDAPQAGTGKSLLAEIISLTATGRPSPMTTAPMNRMGNDDEEWRKRITSILRMGTGLVIIDNLEGTLESPSLAAALTVDTWSDRILGKSENIILPQRATWIATGNNIRLGGDLPRRCYWIRLDAKMARPWERTEYRHKDLTGWVAQNRGMLVASLLCMARAWFVAGKPGPNIREIGGFEAWTRTIGGILEFAGVTGFLANLHELYDTSDEGSQQWQAFLENWHAAYGSRAITVNEFADDISIPIDEYTPRETAARIRALRDTLPERLPESFSRSLGSFKVVLGKALSKKVGVRLPNGVYLERASDDAHSKVARWRVVRICQDDRCGGFPNEGSGGKIIDFTSKNTTSAGDAGDGSSPSQVRTDHPPETGFSTEKGGTDEECKSKTSPASPAAGMKSMQDPNVTHAGDPPAEAEDLVRCGACSNFDGRWCVAKRSWNGRRGQEADPLHRRSSHCNERGRKRA